MKSILLASIVVFSSSAFALPSLKSLKMRMMPAKPMGAFSTECANFSGKWKGACVNEEGEKESVETEIFQERCQDIFLDDESFQIGGSKTEQDHGSRGTSSTSIFFDWTNNKSELAVKGSMTVRVAPETVITAIFDGAWRLENGQMLTTSSYTYEYNGENISGGDSCTYALAK